MATRAFNVRLPEEVLEKLEALARATDRTKTYLAIDAISRYLEVEAWQIQDIHNAISEADDGDFASDRQVKSVFKKYGA